jgi:hypothetical protein
MKQDAEEEEEEEPKTWSMVTGQPVVGEKVQKRLVDWG